MIILIAIVKSQLDLHEQLFLKHEAFDFFLGIPTENSAYQKIP